MHKGKRKPFWNVSKKDAKRFVIKTEERGTQSAKIKRRLAELSTRGEKNELEKGS